MFSSMRGSNDSCVKQGALIQEVIEMELSSVTIGPGDCIHGNDISKITRFVYGTGSGNDRPFGLLAGGAFQISNGSDDGVRALKLSAKLRRLGWSGVTKVPMQFQQPCLFFLMHIGPCFWLARLMTCWGTGLMMALLD